MGLSPSHLGVIVFSRMKSSRLPGKAMLNIAGKPLLERVITRAKLTGYNVILATSDTSEDDILEELSHTLGVSCFRGSEENVLERAVLAAEKFGFKAFARLCGDRPLFSVEEMAGFLQLWAEKNVNIKPDIITNNFPHKALRGLTTEVIKTSSLRRILESSPNAEEKEHVTLGFYNKHSKYKILSLKTDFTSKNANFNYAVDTIEDYLHIQERFKSNTL